MPVGDVFPNGAAYQCPFLTEDQDKITISFYRECPWNDGSQVETIHSVSLNVKPAEDEDRVSITTLKERIEQIFPPKRQN